MPDQPQTRDLPALLHRVFGHRDFRPHQQKVCEAAASGRDVLLVMPTGAGKSLCYQLPALARNGTGLVVSPLIALMDDQAAKLSALNLRVARIHSGLDREASRQACRDYLAGDLDFLFIAPERMRVPGFPEMLARRKPALIAIDEAHCISQWGHDFRPDYRTLGAHLAALRSGPDAAPLIALTATATPTVQRDIAAQLDLQQPAVFITGFRRDNLAIEVVEMSKPQRAPFVLKMLKDDSARPAIVYAGSRKQAEELATVLGKSFPSRAYHAGLAPELRERTQTDFLAGKLDVVVATVAFGMGVDKADIRTVVHVALPGSVEAYYQEIGRAGRDGKPSRTVLLHSFGDRKLQEFFLDRSYPAQVELERVAQALTGDFEPIEDLGRKLKIDSERLSSIVDKLLAAGVAQIDFQNAIRSTGATNWQRGYEAQVNARRSQLDKMIAFAECTACRMTALVEHFGDNSERGRFCGRCDICSPENAQGSTQRLADADDRRLLARILSTLGSRSWSVGKLFAEVATIKDRKLFDACLDGLAKAGFVTLTNDTFRADDGRDITYRKAQATGEGRDADDQALETVWLRGVEPATKKSRGRTSSSKAIPEVNTATWSPTQKQLEKNLRDWRKAEAANSGLPAFRVFGDVVLNAIVSAHPRNVAELEAVNGIGPEKSDKYGAGILRICRAEGSSASTDAKPSTQKVVTPSNAKNPLSARTNPPAQSKPATQPGNPNVSEAKRFPRPIPVEPKPRVETAEVFQFTEAQQQLESRLRNWRKAEAQTQGLPSFFILSDTALKGIVAKTPKSLDELRSIRGIPPEKILQYASEILPLCRT